MKKSDYFFNKNVTIHEGLTTAKLTNASMYFTKEYIYIVPNHSLQVLRLEHTSTDFKNSKDFITDLESKIESMSPNEFHYSMKSFLPKKFIYGIISLDKFTINSEWLTAGIRLKKRGDKLKRISFRPRIQLKELKAFYNL